MCLRHIMSDSRVSLTWSLQTLGSVKSDLLENLMRNHLRRLSEIRNYFVVDSSGLSNSSGNCFAKIRENIERSELLSKRSLLSIELCFGQFSNSKFANWIKKLFSMSERLTQSCGHLFFGMIGSVPYVYSISINTRLFACSTVSYQSKMDN